MGVAYHAVYRSVAKPNEVTVWHDVATLAKAEAFAGSPSPKHAGVTGAATVWMVKEA